MHREYRFVLFNLGFWTWLFNPEEFIRVIQQGCMGGFRILRREITFEPRKFFFIFSRPAFGFVFQKTEQLEPDYEWGDQYLQNWIFYQDRRYRQNAGCDQCI